MRLQLIHRAKKLVKDESDLKNQTYFLEEIQSKIGANPFVGKKERFKLLEIRGFKI